MAMRNKSKVTTVLSGNSGQTQSRYAPPNILTEAERRRLSRLEYADTKLLLEQIRYRHQIFNSIDVEIAIPELPEEEIVQRFLHLANEKPTYEQKVFAMLNCADKKPLSHGYIGEPDIAWAYEEAPTYAVEHWWHSIADTRKEFRNAVHAIIKNPSSARRRYSKKIRDAFGQIVAVPRHVWDGLAGKIELRYFALNTSAACGYVLMLLLDYERPHGAVLRQCKFEECRRPFLGFHASSGSPRTIYCSDECKIFAKRYQTAARQAALRLRNKQAAKRRKGRKS